MASKSTQERSPITNGERNALLHPASLHTSTTVFGEFSQGQLSEKIELNPCDMHSIIKTQKRNIRDAKEIL